MATPAFRRLWVAGLVSDCGDWLLFIALPLVVFELSGSAFGASVAFLLELGPAIALAPLAARLATRFDRRFVMAMVSAGQAVVLLPLLVVDSASDLPILYAVIAAHASLAALFEPAKNSMLPDLVGINSLVSANALVGLNQNLGRLIGGPLGGVLLATGGLDSIVLVDAATYVNSAALILSLPRTTLADSSEVESAGVLAALRARGIRGTFVLLFVTSIAQGMFLVLFVLFVVGPLNGTETEVGLLRGIQAVGAIAAAVIVGLLARRWDPEVLTAGSILVFGVISLLTWNLPAVTTELGLYVVLFALVGAPGVIMATGFVSTLQIRTAPHERAAALAAMGGVMACGQAVGLVLGGLADGPIGLLRLLQLQGVLYLTAAVIAWVLARRPGHG
jgi:predicted MFS family arabinose efflux permease